MPAPRKGAHIFRRKGKRGWYAYIDRTDNRRSLGDVDEAEANRRLAALLDDRGLRAKAEGEDPLAALFDAYCERSKTNHTRKSCRENGFNLARVLRWLHERGLPSVSDVTKQVVEDFKTSRRFDKVSAARINRELQSWKNAMRLGVELEVARPNVVDAFMKLREPRPLPNRPGLTAEQVGAFLEAVDDPGYRALFRVAVGSGLRDDELRHLEASDLRAPHIVVTPKDGWTTKGYRYRHIPVTPATLEAARTFLLRRAGLRLDPKSVWKTIQKARKAAGIKLHFSMHDLRRAFASHALAAGFRLEQISRWLGHADLVTTQRYLRVVDGGEVDTSKLFF